MLGKSLFPFYYTFCSRLNNRFSLIYYLCFQIIPSIYVFIIFSGVLAFTFFIQTVFVLYLYETGYLYNDCILVRRESNPTLRMNKSFRNFVWQNRKLIFITRCMLCLLPFMILKEQNFLFLYSLLIFIIVTYNVNRNVLNFPLHFFMTSIRTAGVAIANIGREGFLILLFYSIPNIVEISIKKKLFKASISIVKLRIIYYSCLCLFFLIAFPIYFPLAIILLAIVFFKDRYEKKV